MLNILTVRLETLIMSYTCFPPGLKVLAQRHRCCVGDVMLPLLTNFTEITVGAHTRLPCQRFFSISYLKRVTELQEVK